MTADEVLSAWRLVMCLSKARRVPGADVPRLDALVRRAVARADRKQARLEGLVRSTHSTPQSTF